MLCDLLFHALERCTDPAFTLTARGEIWTWNRAAEALFGYPAGDALHCSFQRMLEPRGRLGKLINEAYCARAVLNGHAGALDMQMKTRSGRRIWVGVSVLVLEATRTSPAMLVHLAHDITSNVRRERLIRRFADIARQMSSANEDGLRLVPVTPLSEQEERILRALGEGKAPVEITRAFGITAQTFRNHLHHVNRKLGTHNRLEAVIHATRRKLI